VYFRQTRSSFAIILYLAKRCKIHVEASPQPDSQNHSPPTEVIEGDGFSGHFPRASTGERYHQRPNDQTRGLTSDGAQHCPGITDGYGDVATNVIPDKKAIPP